VVELMLTFNGPHKRIRFFRKVGKYCQHGEECMTGRNQCDLVCDLVLSGRSFRKHFF
jgi:hypothetical protein